jgi:hypothetical protein
MQKTQNEIEIETDDMTKLANFLQLIKRLNGDDNNGGLA